MKVIPVLDLLGGHAVLAVGGDRANYRPVRSQLHEGSGPIPLALAFREALGLSTLYLADLDAIAGRPPSLDLFRELKRLGMSLWVDAGLRDASTAASLFDSEVDALVVGLETVRGRDALAEIVALSGPDRLILSLDQKEGRLLTAPGSRWGTDDPRAVADLALGLGLRRLLLLDVAHVGKGRGVADSLPTLISLRADHPRAEIAVGGGIAGPRDLDILAGAGADAVLVASALHDGRIQRGHLSNGGASAFE